MLLPDNFRVTSIFITVFKRVHRVNLILLLLLFNYYYYYLKFTLKRNALTVNENNENPLCRVVVSSCRRLFFRVSVFSSYVHAISTPKILKNVASRVHFWITRRAGALPPTP